MEKSTALVTFGIVIIFLVLTEADKATIARIAVLRKFIFSRYYDNNEQLVREFIPCYRKFDNKPGMYETVLGNFHVNHEIGGNDFLVGLDGAK